MSARPAVNLNVMIDLGMAHALGRPLLAVRRSDAVDVRPKNIEKLRVLRYECRLI